MLLHRAVRGTTLLVPLLLAAGPTLAQPALEPATVVEGLRAGLPPEGKLTIGAARRDPDGALVLENIDVAYDPPLLPEALRKLPGAEEMRRVSGITGLHIAALRLSGVEQAEDGTPSRIKDLTATGVEQRSGQSSITRVETVTYHGAAWAVLGSSLAGDIAADADFDSQTLERMSVEDRKLGITVLVEKGSSGVSRGGVVLDASVDRLRMELPGMGTSLVERITMPRLDVGAAERLTDTVAALGDEATAGATPNTAALVELLGTLAQIMPAFELSGMSITTPALGEMPSMPVGLGRFAYSLGDADPVGSRPFAFELADLTLPAGTVPPAVAAMIPGLPTDTLSLNLAMAGSWDAPQRILALKPFRFSVPALATVELGFSMGALPPASVLLAAKPDSAGSILAFTPVRDLTLSLSDGGALAGWLDQEAARRGVDRASLASSFTEDAKAAGGVRPSEAQTAALRSFLEQPGTLTIAWKPAQPQPIAYLGVIATQQPALLLNDLTITATPPTP